ncbi:hypothetical protein ACFS7Z_26545 [Pontibacter toksunensis]|uniref:Beta-lactamase-inhibitor-like PepSY-like domain-containing protein n=1 Tax=Pontibacter toksunensis TaxID=1332631 RepID=A0ABW6C1K5_9BACT
MKLTRHYLFALGLLLLSCSTEDSEVVPNDVPEQVKSTLTSNFSAAMDVEWEKTGGNYTAEFEVAGVDHDALITPAGELLQYKHTIPDTELPDAVTAAILQQHSDKHLDEAEKLYRGNEVFYQVEMENTGTDLYLVFSPDGQEQAEPAFWD